MKECTKEEFTKFIAEYPAKLEASFLTTCEPPPLQYNDFSEGKRWPESVVAQTRKEIDGNYKRTGEVRYWADI